MYDETRQKVYTGSQKDFKRGGVNLPRVWSNGSGCEHPDGQGRGREGLEFPSGRSDANARGGQTYFPIGIPAW